MLQKMVYILANLVGIGLAVWKFNSMGLLPTSQSDWLEFMDARHVSKIILKSWIIRVSTSSVFCFRTWSSVVEE